jgi:cytochrome c oxidase subunit 3
VNFFRELATKPWLPGTVENDHDGRAFQLPTAKVGLRWFLAVVTILFSILIVAYGERMEYADWRPMPEPWLLWLNTALLMLSSVAFERARIAVHRGRLDGVRAGLFAGGILAFAFLVGQVLAWKQLSALGFYSAANPANAFFYLITMLHALHLLGGLVAWGRITARARPGSDVADLRLGVELCAVYWHFLLVVWLVLFGLLIFT